MLLARLSIGVREKASPPRRLLQRASTPIAQGAIAANQRVGGAVVAELGLGLAGELGGGAPGQHLAQLHAPLVERVDTPHHALDEGGVLVQRYQRAERVRGE